ncbi:MAG TPA: glycosyltransferase family 4 protein [Polyangiaceae bacterium]|nr:glycosyltransferase family 4 protein [Polyangiaceae bacterium]
MRVLHVHSGNLWGGIEGFLTTLARRAELVPEMRSEFALCFDGRLQRELESAGATLTELGRVRARSPWSLVRARRELRRLLADRKYDVVVCHSAWTQAMFGGMPRVFGVPEVFYLHDRVRDDHWLERWAARHPPDWAIVNSEYTRHGLVRLFPRTGVDVVYYPIEAPTGEPSPDERRALRAELGVYDDTVLIMQACRMQAWKGHDRLLRALAHLRAPTIWLCVLIGDAQRPAERAYRAKLEEDARALGVTARVRFLGQRDDVPRLLRAADIHCQPNAEPEPFGIAFVEALQAGLPTVTLDMGGPREIVTPAVGRLVTNEGELARALDELVNDAALRRKLGAAGPERARRLCDPRARLTEIAAVLARVSGAPVAQTGSG